ncbi:hypothetical protein Tco_0960888 [Tanacetum coccineum]
MIGRKVMRTLASVEVEIILILGFPCCLSSSVRCLENVVVPVRSRVPVPLPNDPYEAIRQAYLVGTDIESEPIEDPIKTKAPESPHIVALPTLLPDSIPPICHDEESEGSDTSGARSTSSDSTAPLLLDHPLTHTTPTLVPILCKTAHMVVRVPPAMPPGLPASVAEVEAMSDSTFYKRFRSSYESSPSSSSLDLPSRKRYRGTSELVKDDDDEEEDDEEGDDEDEDKEIKESLDSNSVSENIEDEGPTAEDEGPAAEVEGPAVGDEGLAARDKGPDMRVEGLSLGRDEAVPGGQQRAAPVVEITVGEPLGLRYEALRRQEIALGEGWMPSVFEVDLEDGIVYIDVPAYPPPAPPAQTPPSPEWSSGLLPIYPAPSIVPSPILSPMISLTVPSLVASPATTKTEGFLTELGARVEMQEGLIRDHTVRLEELSSSLFERPIIALKSWAVQTDAQRAALWHAISDTQGKIQLVKERHARLELAKVVDSIRRGQEPRGDV